VQLRYLHLLQSIITSSKLYPLGTVLPIFILNDLKITPKGYKNSTDILYNTSGIKLINLLNFFVNGGDDARTRNGYDQLAEALMPWQT
jgi:hypothetical protein